MALAFLKLNHLNQDTAEFELDIGTNKLYKIKFGEDKIYRQGLELVDEIIYETPLSEGPEFNVFNSSFTTAVPLDKFDVKPKYAQLFSFKDDRKKSPAVSNVVEIFPKIDLNEDMPAMTSPLNVTDMNRCRGRDDNCPCKVRAIGFSFKEAPLSMPMFWDALIEAARLLVPSAVNALAGLIGSGNGNGQSSNNQNIVGAIDAVLGALRSNQGTATASGPEAPRSPATPSPATPSPAPPAASTPSPSAESSRAPPPAAPADSAVPVVSAAESYAQGVDYLSFQRRIFREKRDSGLNKPFRPRFARTSSSPLLDIRMPDLGQMLVLMLQQSPQLLQILADNPAKMLNLLILQQLLRSATHGLPHQSPLATPIARPSSIGFALARAEPKSTVILQKGNPITVNGKPKFVYSGKGNINLMAHLDLVEGVRNGKIGKAIIDLSIKDSLTMQVVLEKSFRLKDIAANSFQELELLSSEIQNLPRNKDLIVSVIPRYLGADNRPHTGRADVHLIFIVNDYFYKGIGNKINESIPLNDRTKYRIFWNKIWEGGTKTKRRWEVNLTTKYYIYYRYDLSTNGRIETKIQQVQPDRESERELKIEGRMKSGSEVTPDELSNLLPAMGSYNPLEESKLKAFKTDELSKDYNSEALSSLELRGRTGETGMIWTYPEISLFEFSLNKISSLDKNGQVTGVSEVKIVFPKPVSIHFVGEKTIKSSYQGSREEEDTEIENNADIGIVEDLPSEGYEKVFDIKVELRPTELAPIRVNP